MNNMFWMASLRAFGAKQRGVVLVIALIALVALSMAGIAMMRTVDAGNVISRNMSFKQASIVASDFGLETAMARMNATILGTNRDSNFPDTNAGAVFPNAYYFATFQAADELGRPRALVSAPTCVGAAQTPYRFDVLDGSNNPTGFCNTIFIERMCSEAGTPDNERCVMPTKGVESSGGEIRSGEKIPPSPTPFYRITVRVEGPLNTQVYTQGFLSLR